MAGEDGLLLCPEGAATVAGYRRALADGLVQPEAKVVLFNCATGIKYPLPAVEQRIDCQLPIDYGRFM